MRSSAGSGAGCRWLLPDWAIQRLDGLSSTPKFFSAAVGRGGGEGGERGGKKEEEREEKRGKKGEEKGREGGKEREEKGREGREEALDRPD